MVTPPSDEVKMNCRSSLLSLLTELSVTRSSGDSSVPVSHASQWFISCRTGETADAPWYLELACYAQV